LVNVNTIRRYVPLFVDDRPVLTFHLSVRLQSVGPDLSQPLGEVFSLLEHWFEPPSKSMPRWLRITRSESRHAATIVN
jgi:hypothetical protein